MHWDRCTGARANEVVDFFNINITYQLSTPPYHSKIALLGFLAIGTTHMEVVFHKCSVDELSKHWNSYTNSLLTYIQTPIVQVEYL